MIPVVEGLLPEPHNTALLKLLYRLAEWHALAKLCMHTEHTLRALEISTTEIGSKLRGFRDSTAKSFKCRELPEEVSARDRKRHAKEKKKAETEPLGTNKAAPPPPLPKISARRKVLSLLKYKFHALGDYVNTIRMFGTTDSYSTQIVCGTFYSPSTSESTDLYCIIQGELAHRIVKRFYRRTNKIKAAKQIAKHQQRSTRLQRARQAAMAPRARHAHHVAFSENDPLPHTGVFLHHHLSTSKNYPQHLLHFVQNPPNDPSKKVHFYWIHYLGLF